MTLDRSNNATYSGHWRARIPVAAFGVLVAVGLGLYAIAYARDAPRLRTSASAAERAAGRVRGVARFRPQAPVPIPPCMAQFSHDDSTATSDFNGDNRVDFDDGTSFLLPEAATVDFLDDVPPSAPPSDAAVAYERKKHPDVKEFKMMACLGPETRVWVEGCVLGSEIRGCPETDRHLRITIGGARALGASITRRAMGFLAAALVAASAAAVVLALRLTRRRLVDALAQRREVRRLGVAVALSGLTTLAGLGAALFHVLGPPPWMIVAAAGVVGAAAFVFATRGVLALVAARRALGRDPGAGPDGERACVEARVADDAPTFEGLDGARPALIRYEIGEVHEDGESTQVRPLKSATVPAKLAIQHATGRGEISLDHATLDVPAEPATSTTAGRLPPWVHEGGALPSLSTSNDGLRLTTTILEPGETILVFGEMERTGKGAADAVYRERREDTRIAGTPAAPVIVHVGARAQVARAIRDELIATTAAVVIALGAMTSAALLAGWALAL